MSASLAALLRELADDLETGGRGGRGTRGRVQGRGDTAHRVASCAGPGGVAAGRGGRIDPRAWHALGANVECGRGSEGRRGVAEPRAFVDAEGSGLLRSAWDACARVHSARVQGGPATVGSVQARGGECGVDADASHYGKGEPWNRGVFALVNGGHEYVWFVDDVIPWNTLRYKARAQMETVVNEMDIHRRNRWPVGMSLHETALRFRNPQSPFEDSEAYHILLRPDAPHKVLRWINRSAFASVGIREDGLVGTQRLF